MTLEEAIQATLISNDHIMTEGDVETYIANKNLLKQTANLSQKIHEYFSKPPNYIFKFRNGYIYVPIDEKIDSLLYDLLKTDPDRNIIKEIKNIDDRGLQLANIMKISDSRVRFLYYLEVKEYFLYEGFSFTGDYVNALLGDKNEKINALALVVFLEEDFLCYYLNIFKESFDYLGYLKNLENPFLIEQAYELLDYVLTKYNNRTIQKNIADLLLHKNQIFSVYAYDFIFNKTPIVAIPIIFYILEHWNKYKKYLDVEHSINRDTIYKKLNQCPVYTPPFWEFVRLNEEFMLDYCNSDDLNVKEKAITFMIQRWSKISNINKIKKRSNLLNTEIKIQILNSYLHLKSIKAIYYAKKWIYDNDVMVVAKSALVLGEAGSNDEKDFLYDYGRNYMKKTNDVAPDYIRIALDDIKKRLGED